VVVIATEEHRNAYVGCGDHARVVHQLTNVVANAASTPRDRFGPQVRSSTSACRRYQLAQALRLTLGAGVRMIAVTGYGQDQDRVQSADAGFAARLTPVVY
jgi:hypothetical protein